MCRCSRWNSGRLQHQRHIDAARGAHVLFGGRYAGREARARWEMPARYTGIPRRNAGNEKQGVWSVRDRRGGTSSPSPSAPPPVAISPRSSARGEPGEEPDTAAHQLHPGHGCSPDIATYGPRPRGGGGGGAPKARVGWGCRQRAYGHPRRNAGGEDR